MFGIIEKGEYGFSNVSLFRPPSAQAFGSNELQLLRFLIPHIHRAYRIHFKLSDIKSRNQSLNTAFNTIPTALVLVDSKGRILAMNQAASQLTLANDGLLATRNGLRAEQSNESTRLQESIAQAIATSVGKGLGPAGAVSISRRKDVSLQVLVTPIGNGVFDTPSPVRAIVFVNDSSRKSRPAHHALKMLFGLAPAECRVALLLADGLALAEIATTLGVTANTLKSHLSSVYGKRGTSRQSQLARLLLQLAVE